VARLGVSPALLLEEAPPSNASGGSPPPCILMVHVRMVKAHIRLA
jgi:hypothetical protein